MSHSPSANRLSERFRTARLTSRRQPAVETRDRTPTGNIRDRAIDTLNLEQARADVLPFVPDPDALTLWSRAFFHDVTRPIVLV